MIKTVRSERLHIVFVGVCNAGKSSLMNALAGRSLSIVSDEPGTTTDPVEKSMEFGSLGPVVLVDTAGLYDTTSLGRLRELRTLEAVSRGDIFVLVSRSDQKPLAAERDILEKLLATQRPILVAATFSDAGIDPEKAVWLKNISTFSPILESGGKLSGKRIALCHVSSISGSGLNEAKTELAALNMEAIKEKTPLDGLVGQGDIVILVTPVDSAAPKGRLILPEAAVLRDALDRGCITSVVQPGQLAACYAVLAKKPRLVVTDSQAFSEVVASLPEAQALTSFSILFARKKGELSWFERGIDALDRLHGKDFIELLAIEACTHNRTHEDIATVKIPALLAAKTGTRVKVSPVRALCDIPPERSYDLAVICGSCMATRSAFIAQMRALEAAGIPVVNFGIMLAWGKGLLRRALEPLQNNEDRRYLNSRLYKSAEQVLR